MNCKLLSFLLLLILNIGLNSAQAAQPSVLWLANSPSEPAKARMLAEIAREHQVRLKPLFIMGQDAETITNEMKKYDMVMFDYVYMGQFVQVINQYRGAIAQ